LIDDARSGELPHARSPIIASDRDAGAVTAAIENARRAGVASDIVIENHSLSEMKAPAEQGWIVSNPPYGLRVGDAGPLKNLYARLGQIIRAHAPKLSLALLSADKSLDAQLRTPLEEVFRTTNGGIPVRLVVGRSRKP
jgi:putative N6-adenine-specific DNA methylase